MVKISTDSKKGKTLVIYILYLVETPDPCIERGPARNHLQVKIN